MVNKLQQRKQSGFTIVEVVIVLAIAAMILLVVLLAVPALQRSSRNTAIKNDASAVAATINDYVSNNDGKLPATADIDVNSGGNGKVVIGASGTNQAEGKVQGSTTLATLTGKPTSGAAANQKGLGVGQIGIRLKETCAGVSTPRAVAVWYFIEGSTNGVGCVDV